MRRLLAMLCALAAVAGIAPVLSGANFAVQTSNPQTIGAATDFVAPTVTGSAIATTSGGSPIDGAGYVAQGGTYRIYANVTDAGNPASGVGTVTANVSNVSNGGHSAVALVAGSFTVGGVTYGYASAEQTASNPLAEGSVSYTVSATDNAANASSPASFSVTVDDTAPAITGSIVARTDGDAPGFLRQGDSYYVYANATDSASGINHVSANVSALSSGVTASNLSSAGGPWTVAGVSYKYRSASLTAGSPLSEGATGYTITAVDNAANSATSPTSGAGSFSVVIDNTAPAVTLTAPASSAIVRGSITPAATATDGGSGVASVKIQRSPAGANTWTDVCTITTSPYSCSLDTTTLTDGLYDFRAVAADALGNSANSAAATNVRVDNTPPAVTMADPGSPLTGTVTLSSSSATDTGGSGVASLKYQYAPTGTTTWTDACTGTTGPSFSCSFNTSGVAAGNYDFRALATDNAGNTGTSATIASRQVGSGPMGVQFDAENCTPVSATCVAGKANAGDTISFTYNTAIDPASIVPATTNPAQPAWDGTSARNVKVTLQQGGSNDTLTEVQLDVGSTTVSLGTVALGANYLNGTTSSFSPSPIAMSNGGKTFTITLGAFSGTASQLQTVTSAGTVDWTPSNSAKDMFGNPVSTTLVQRSFVAF